MTIDIQELREAIKIMTRRQELYRALKEELTAKGHWKNLGRGDPKKGYRVSRNGRKPK